MFGNGQSNAQGVNPEKINQLLNLNFKAFDENQYDDINCEKEENFINRFEEEILVEREIQTLQKKELAEKKIDMLKVIQASLQRLQIKGRK